MTDRDMTEEATDPRIRDLATAIFAAQPFSALIGARLTEVGEITEIRIPNRAELHQQHGFVHGGVLSYLADNSLTFAGGLALGGDAVTSQFTINYIRPAVGDAIIARAKVRSVTRTQAVCECSLHAVTDDADGADRLVAVALGTIVKAHASAA